MSKTAGVKTAELTQFRAALSETTSMSAEHFPGFGGRGDFMVKRVGMTIGKPKKHPKKYQAMHFLP